MQIGIIGGGSWATALAKLLTHNGHTIQWWLRSQKVIDHFQRRRHNPHYLQSAYFNPQQLHMSTNMQQVIAASQAIVVCIPSSYLLPSIQDLPQHALQGKKVISAIKGVLPHTHQLLNEYLQQHYALPVANYFTIMGPCHAEEVAAEKLSYLTFSGEDEATTQTIAAHFKTEYLNTIINHDIWGTQYAAVLKNIYAVGAGIAHGLDYGDNFLSVYTANVADEMVHFLKKVMEHKHAPDAGIINYASSVYLGDLLVTCYSPFSRNRTFGNMIGKGYSVRVAQLEMNMVAEGYPASKGIFHINQTINAHMPIASAIYNMLWNGLEAADGFKQIEAVLQ
ncbi:MAG: glycerol-3-phosphate dehydrogenase [Bacteroidetes bacterium]|nr:MAG: glycerol-3-phosphate dehydrogenase [Bacteroidota bacterium]